MRFMKPLLRDALGSLERWFGKRRRKPLVVRGARQVGKSTLVRLFAERKSLLAEVNLERHADVGDEVVIARVHHRRHRVSRG